MTHDQLVEKIAVREEVCERLARRVHALEQQGRWSSVTGPLGNPRPNGLPHPSQKPS